MALAVSRAGTIFKKCDMSDHRPDTNRRCQAAACQHTCANIEKCPHAWTLRYSANGKQVEKSFRDKVHETTGRTLHGSGRKLAQDFQLKLTVDKRSGDITFAASGNGAKGSFGSAVEAYISRLPVGDTSKKQYRANYRTHIRPVFGERTLGQVANDRDGVLDFLAVAMKDKSLSVRTIARLLIVGTAEEAVKAGRLSRHRLLGIDLAHNGTKQPSDFIFPSFSQVKFVADGGISPNTKRAIDGAGICVWLMRACGLRIEEALAVEKADFKDNGSYLRVMWQATRDGKGKVPLKARKSGEYRDVPVPTWLWEIVKDMPDGPLMPGNGSRPFQLYSTIYARFIRAAEAAGIPDGFTPHSLRHLFASVMLGQGIQITDLAKWLGHKNINITYATYGHLLPNANDKAVKALDAEFAEWSKQG